MSNNSEENNKKDTLKIGGSKLKFSGLKSGSISHNASHGKTNNIQVEVRRKKRFSIQGSIKSDSLNDSLSSDPEIDKKLRVLQKASEIDKQKKEDELRLDKVSKERSEAKNIKEQIKNEELSKSAVALNPDNSVKDTLDDKQSSRIDLKKDPSVSPDNINHEIKPIISHSVRDKRVIKEIVTKEEKKEKLKLSEKKQEENLSVQPKNSQVFSKVDKKNVQSVEKEEKKIFKTSADTNKRRSGKLTITQALSGGGEERIRSLASVKRARAKAKRSSNEAVAKEKRYREVTVPEVITVQELANRMAERVVDITKSLMKMGMMVTANQTIDADTAELVIEEFGHTIKRVTDADVEDILFSVAEESIDNLQERAPIVTFMGHVDHGKTSLLDKIRETRVTAGEAGGITQHIGAYQVNTEQGDKITFLDTPGHEAFTAMRQRGANATDIVVLVVAADDGIMAQTVEAINHAKAADVPIIVAINKIDKPDANAQSVRTSLLEHDLVTEDMGGEILSVEVSAKSGKNIDILLETILMQSELLELRANPNRKASGVVVEAKVDKNKGVISTFLVQKGSLKIGDIVIVGEAYGKVRAMKNAEGKKVDKAAPSLPVEVLGLDVAPEAGVEFHVVDSEKQAREIKEYRQKRARDLKATMQQKRGTLEDLFLKSKDNGKKELPILIKGDVQGSVEAIIGSLDKLETEEVSVKVLHKAVGGISTSDITLASASNAMILGFNVRADSSAKTLADQEGADIRYYSIIYDLIDDVKTILGGMLPPLIREQHIGNAEIRDVFNITKSGKVAGCYVTEGVIKRGSGVRLLRDNVVIHEGKLKTLKRFKDDAKEVATNFECGMAFEKYEDIKVGDIIEAFEVIEEKRSL